MPYEASPEDFLEPKEAVADTGEIRAVSQASAEAAAPAELPQDAVVIHEVELLARFEQMEAMPLLPPEIGTAVIFNPRSAPSVEVRGAPEPAEAVSSASAAPALTIPATEATASDTAATETVSAEARGPEAFAPEAISPEPVLHGHAAEFSANEVTVPHADADEQPVLAEAPCAEATPATAPGQSRTVDQKIPAMLLPSLDLNSASATEATAAPEANVPAADAGPAIPPAELSAIETVIAEAFSDHEPPAEAPTPPAAEHPSASIASDIVEEPLRSAAAEPVEAAAAPEAIVTQAADPDSAPDAVTPLPPVNLDAEFDADEFLFGEDAVAPAPETPEAAAAIPAAPVEAAAEPQPGTRPDPLIPIKAMTPEERIALFS
jgi:hypothetical protein